MVTLVKQETFPLKVFTIIVCALVFAVKYQAKDEGNQQDYGAECQKVEVALKTDNFLGKDGEEHQLGCHELGPDANFPVLKIVFPLVKSRALLIRC